MDIKTRIDALTDAETKAALLWFLEYVVKLTPCWRCPLTECDICDVENKGRLRKYFLDEALKGVVKRRR